MPLFILMPIGQSLAWKRGDLLAAAQRLTYAIGVRLHRGAGARGLARRSGFSAMLCGLAVYVILGSFADIGRRLFAGGASLGAAWQSALGLPRQAFGSAFAHAGIGVTLLGLAATGWGAERITALTPGETVDDRSLSVHFRRRRAAPGPNYAEVFARTTIRSGGVVKAVDRAVDALLSRRASRAVRRPASRRSDLAKSI